MKHQLLRLIVLTAALVCGAPSLFAQASAFTYQGRLNDASGPANGVYDLVFTLQGAASGAAPVGVPVAANGTVVSNGLFTVTLDFGAPALDGGVRWLEIAVKTNGAPGFATLAPRQALTSTPYAVRAANASAYSGTVAAGQITGTLAPALIGAGSITGDKLAAGSVTGTQLAAGAVTSGALADGAVSVQKLQTLPSTPLLTTFINPTPANADYFGISVAAVGNDRVLIGAFGDDAGAANAGAAYLFSTNGTLLTTFTNPTPSNFDVFGYSVAAVGTDRALIGAYGDDTGATDAGTAYLFSTNGALLTTFTNPTPANADYFGFSVAAVGSDRVLIGANQDDTGATNAGAAYLFSTNGTLLTTFTTPSPAVADNFGSSVAAVGTDRVLIGAPLGDTGATNAGAAYLFSTNGTLLATFTNPTPAVSDNFGYSVAAVGTDRVLIGAYGDDTGAPNAGAAYLFNTNGTLLATFINPTPANLDSFGFSGVALGSDSILVGSYADDAGAAYLFNLNGAPYVPGLVSQGVVDQSITSAALAPGAVLSALTADNVNFQGSNTVIGAGNVVSNNVRWSTIAGGGQTGFPNSIGSGSSFIGAGNLNRIGTNSGNSAIGAGFANLIAGYGGFIGSGNNNSILSNAFEGAIGGGESNVIAANADFAAIPGGQNNVVGGDFGFAAGRRAKANHAGAFVWADTTDADFSSTASNQFLIRATGGVGINTNNPNGAALAVNGTVTATGFSGDGSGLTGVTAAAFTGPVGDGQLPANVVRRDQPNTFTGDQSITGGNLVVQGGQTVTSDQIVAGSQRVQGNVGLGTDPSPSSKLLVNGTVTATSFSGSGSGLTGIDAASVTSGTLPDARLTLNIPRLDQGNTFSGPITATGFIGEGTALTGVAKLGGNNSFTGNQSINGGLYVDTAGVNNGTFLDPAPRLVFGGTGNSSGEGIASKRTAGGNQFGLDFYTGYTPRLSIQGNGSVGIGTNSASDRLHVVGQSVRARVEGTDSSFAGFLAKNTAGEWFTGVGGASGDWTLFQNSPSSASRLVVTTSGNVGIGRTSTANKLEVAGNASKDTAGSWLANSDRRIKQDIRTVDSALDTLNRVRLVSFRYTDDYRAAHPSLTDRPYLNVIAQEFAEVFPEHVQSSGEKLPDGSEILQVDTYPLTIYSAAAVQELSRKVEEKDAKIAALEARLEKLERLMEAKGGAR